MKRLFVSSLVALLIAGGIGCGSNRSCTRQPSCSPCGGGVSAPMYDGSLGPTLSAPSIQYGPTTVVPGSMMTTPGTIMTNPGAPTTTITPGPITYTPSDGQ